MNLSNLPFFKAILLLVAILTSSLSFAELSIGPEIGDIERDDRGNVLKKINYYAASRHCEAKGSRLPTAREYAQLSRSMGAKGIKETAHESKNWDEVIAMRKENFTPIWALDNQDKVWVDFYFNSSGYELPEDHPRNGWGKSYALWTSSVNPQSVNTNMYIFYENRGTLTYTYPHDTRGMAVRCMSLH